MIAKLENKTKLSAHRFLILSFVILIGAMMLLSANFLPTANATTNSITLSKSGLDKQDSLTQWPDKYWKLNGDAKSIGGSAQGFFNSSGLFVGAETPTTGVYAGWYACACKQARSATLFHANVTMYYTSSPYDFNTGLYVQTSSPMINYIFCGADANSSGYYWDVVETYGNSNQATQFIMLYSQKGGPLTEECTIITNGSNYLKVYLGNKLVFSSNSMDQQMTTPFQSYLEVETAVAGQMWWGKYTNYYATTGEYVKVTNVPASSTVEIVNSTGFVLVSAPSGSHCGTNCKVQLEVANFDLPLAAQVEVIQSGVVTASSGLTTIWAGDVYSVV